MAHNTYQLGKFLLLHHRFQQFSWKSMVNPIALVPLFQHPTSPPLFQRSLTTLVPWLPWWPFLPILPFSLPKSPSIPHTHHPTCKWPWGCMKPPITPKVQKRSELSWTTPRDTATAPTQVDHFPPMISAIFWGKDFGLQKNKKWASFSKFSHGKCSWKLKTPGCL